jgi:hypothetical protein
MSLLTSFPLEIFILIQQYILSQEYRLFLSTSKNSYFQRIKYETVTLKFSLYCHPSYLTDEKLLVLQRLLQLKDYSRQFSLSMSNVPIPSLLSHWKEIMPSPLSTMFERLDPEEKDLDEFSSCVSEAYSFSNMKELSISSCSMTVTDLSFSLSFTNVKSLKLENLSWLFSLNTFTSCEQLEELCLVNFWNLTDISILHCDNRIQVFRNLKNLNIKQCHSLVDFPCLSYLDKLNIEDCHLFLNLNPVFDETSKETTLSSATAKLDSFSFKHASLSLSSINYSLQYLSSLTIVCELFTKDCNLSCLSNGSFTYLRLVSCSFVKKSFFNLKYLDCQTLLLEGFKMKKNVRFSTNLRKLLLRSCSGFLLECEGEGETESYGREKKEKESEMTWQKFKAFHLFEFKTIRIPLTLRTFHLLNCCEINDVSMLGRVKHLCLEGLPGVTTVEGLGNGNESVSLSNLDHLKDFSPLNGIYKVSIWNNPYLVDGNNFTKVQHLKLEACHNLKDISMLKNVKSLVCNDCPRVKRI